MGERLGGRAAGTPNKATATLKTFLDGLFGEAIEHPNFRARLLAGLVDGTMEPKVFTTLLAYWAGRPSVAVDHKVEGSLTLAELIVGAAPASGPEATPEE